MFCDSLTGHTGAIATSVLIPQCVDACRGRTSPLHGGPVHVLAAGGVYDGRGLAAALAWGAVGAWVGTRFICAAESGAPEVHRRAVLPVAEIFRSTLFVSQHS